MQFGNVPMILKGCGFGGQGEGASLTTTFEYDNDKESFMETEFGRHILHKAPELRALIEAEKDDRSASISVSRFGGLDLHELTAHKCNANSRQDGATPHFTVAGVTMTGSVKIKIEHKDTEDFTGDWVYVEVKFRLPCSNLAGLSGQMIGKLLRTELWMDTFVTNQAARPIVRDSKKGQGQGGAAADLFEGETDEPVPPKPDSSEGFDEPAAFDPDEVDTSSVEPEKWSPFSADELLDLKKVGSLEDYVNTLTVSQLQTQIKEAYPGQTASQKDKGRLRNRLTHLVKPAPVGG